MCGVSEEQPRVFTNGLPRPAPHIQPRYAISLLKIIHILPRAVKHRHIILFMSGRILAGVRLSLRAKTKKCTVIIVALEEADRIGCVVNH